MLTGQGKRLMIAVLAACAILVLAIAALAAFAASRLGVSSAGVARAVARILPDRPPQPEHIEPVAAGAGPALPADPAAWFTADDYPLEARLRSEQGTVRFAASFDADGRVEKCTIVESSGSAALDEATCRIVAQRARLQPRAATGKPLPVIEKDVKWVLGD